MSTIQLIKNDEWAAKITRSVHEHWVDEIEHENQLFLFESQGGWDPHDCLAFIADDLGFANPAGVCLYSRRVKSLETFVVERCG